MTALDVQKAYQLASLPEKQRWLIEELWSHQAVGIIGGEPKSYKSFLALSMAVAITSGQPCLGRYSVAEPGSVLLFAAEDAFHIVRERLEGICNYLHVDFAKLDLWVITTPVIRLDQDKDRFRLLKTVEKHRPRLLVLDPLVRLHNVTAAQIRLCCSSRSPFSERCQCHASRTSSARFIGNPRMGRFKSLSASEKRTNCAHNRTPRTNKP